MLAFASDYMEGAHEKILARLAETNLEHIPGYGSDGHCENAKRLIREACACPDAEIFFLTGGTQTNQIAIDCALRPYEGVVAPQTGHVNTHESGAIEFTGHKVLSLPEREGKLSAEDLSAYLAAYYADENHEHMVKPGMVYISHPTEYGTLYTKRELTDLSKVCGSYGIPLYLDGARLAYALASRGSDVTLPDIAALTDIFYIGGTKCGALFGEALVYTKKNMPPWFPGQVKQHGALLAKGWVPGVMFETLFADGLYGQIGKNAIDTAERLKEGLRERGYELFLDSPTNQQFVIVDDAVIAKLRENSVMYSFWEGLPDGRLVIRLATSWATRLEDVEELLRILS